MLNEQRVTVEDGGFQPSVSMQAEALDRGAGGGQHVAGDGRQVEVVVLGGAAFAAGQGEQRL